MDNVMWFVKNDAHKNFLCISKSFKKYAGTRFAAECVFMGKTFNRYQRKDELIFKHTSAFGNKQTPP